MRAITRWLLVAMLGLGPAGAGAAFHLWEFTELYSNADGSVQFLEMRALAGSQQFLAGHKLQVTDGVTTRTFTFPSDLPGDTAGKRMLIGTTGFAALGVVTPDYVVPNGFFFLAAATLTFPGPPDFANDTWNYPNPPAPPFSLNRADSTTSINSPTNFAGQTGSVPGPPLAIAITPSPVRAADTSVGTSSPSAPGFLTNNHTAPVTVSAVAVTGDFSVQTSCVGMTLTPGGGCGFTLGFRPTAAGTRSGTLTVTSDAPGSPHTAPLTGTGELSLVTHYYRSILRREPDAGGKSFWTAEQPRVSGLGANVNEVWFAMAMNFYFSAEYAAFGRNADGFVTDLYNTFFNRPPDSGGLAFWAGNLAAGMPREVALAEFMFSTEFGNFARAIFGNTAARAELDMVMDFYRGLLARLPDNGGFGFWVQRFRAAQCSGAPAVVAEVEAISSAFALSPEYAGRSRGNAQYVGDLYNAFLRRGGDLQGVQFWLNELNLGRRTREQLRVEFRNSPEFQQRVNAVIAQGCMQ